MLRVLSEKSDWDIFGSISVEGVKRFFSASIHKNLIAVVDLELELELELELPL